MKIFLDHKIPRKFYFIKEIPKTSRGKINRDLVKNFCLKNEKIKLNKRIRIN